MTPRRRAYRRWAAMIRRCTDPSEIGYHRYGGRGIAVCPEWMDFAVYYAYVGDPPSPSLSLDRIDNDRGYEPGNVRWATASVQARNRHDHNGSATHCANGHRFTPENTYVTSTKYDGYEHRLCRACDRERKAAARAMRRASAEMSG